MKGVDLRSLPDRDKLLAPVTLFGAWEPNPHPNLRKLRSRIDLLIRTLEGFAKGRITMDVVDLPADEEERHREQLATYLDAARSVHQMLESRLPRIVEREASRFTPSLAPRLIQAREAAIYAVKQWRALLAFAIEEDDGTQLGIELIPAPPPIAPPSRSVDFEF